MSVRIGQEQADETRELFATAAFYTELHGWAIAIGEEGENERDIYALSPDDVLYRIEVPAAEHERIYAICCMALAEDATRFEASMLRRDPRRDA